MIHTTTYVHVHEDDPFTVAPANTSERLQIVFGDSPNIDVTVWMPIEKAQELAQAILARYPLVDDAAPRPLTSPERERLRAAGWPAVLPAPTVLYPE